jgi:phospholipase D1/2
VTVLLPAPPAGRSRRLLGRTAPGSTTTRRSARRPCCATCPGLARTADDRDGSPRAALGLPRLHPATHHQKLAVFDRRRLYIGGLDLDERRWDTPEHDRPGAETWQDLQL